MVEFIYFFPSSIFCPCFKQNNRWKHFVPLFNFNINHSLLSPLVVKIINVCTFPKLIGWVFHHHTARFQRNAAAMIWRVWRNDWKPAYCAGQVTAPSFYCINYTDDYRKGIVPLKHYNQSRSFHELFMSLRNLWVHRTWCRIGIWHNAKQQETKSLVQRPTLYVEHHLGYYPPRKWLSCDFTLRNGAYWTLVFRIPLGL